MSVFLGSLRKRVFGIPAGDIAFERRGFRGANAAMRARLEHIGRAFASGYHAALEDDNPKKLRPRLSAKALADTALSAGESVRHNPETNRSATARANLLPILPSSPANASSGCARRGTLRVWPTGWPA